MPTSKNKKTKSVVKKDKDAILNIFVAYSFIFSFISISLLFWQIYENYDKPRMTILPRDIIIAAIVWSTIQLIVAILFTRKKYFN